jgi:DHA1 family solute carrier family 18 vesicular amine transporter 1/2
VWRRRLTVLLVSLALFNDMLQLSMLTPIIPSLIASPPPLGVRENSEVAMGLLFAIKDVCQLTAAPVAGWLTSRHSSHAALCISTAGLGLATISFAEATTFTQLLVARGCQGAASAATMSGGLSLIAETHSEANRGRAMGIAYTGLALGVMSGPLVGGLLFQRMGRRATFHLAGAFVLANALAQVLLMASCPPTFLKHQDKKSSVALSSIFKLLSNADVLAVAASTVAVNGVLGMLKPLSQLILDREFQMGVVARSLVISVATVTYVGTTPIAGILSDSVPRARLLSLSLVLMALSTLALALRCLGFWTIIVACGLVGSSAAFRQVCVSSVVS